MCINPPVIILWIAVDIRVSIHIFVEPSIDEVLDRLRFGDLQPEEPQHSDVLSNVFAPIRVPAFVVTIFAGSRVGLG